MSETLTPTAKKLLVRLRRRGHCGLSLRDISGRFDRALVRLKELGLADMAETIEGPIYYALPRPK